VRLIPQALRGVSPVELAERLRVERTGEPFLLYLDGEGRQCIFELADRRALSIGRQISNDVALPWDTEISRVHAMLEPVAQEWVLVDDGLSRNGSFVNGRRARFRHRLADGDRVTLGNTQIVFFGPGRRTAATTATARDSAPPELSVAQRRVLAELCRPLRDDPFGAPPSNREIGDRLVISVETVKSHLHALFELFEVGDMPQNRKRAELVRRAFARGAGMEDD
jgi:pSer/pThr/pTyr-binding forkhead associated (FHA) protein